ncbi:hypothetical protein [Microbulbifer sp. JMSA008]|uniref:hypothetical protein n=1 Tax=Microbulbifer sp. JMSA008 TaxID=3243373 RepID=UPI00403A2FA4
MTDFIKAAKMASPAYANEPKAARSHAVATALEIIRARASSASTDVNLESEFKNLSKFADQIQSAMESGSK